MLDDGMRRVVREQRLGFIASVCRDGTPNLSPKGTLATVHREGPTYEAGLGSPRSRSAEPGEGYVRCVSSMTLWSKSRYLEDLPHGCTFGVWITSAPASVARR